MKIIRQIALTALVTMGMFTTVLYTGCKDKCGKTTCQNGGTCENNICKCPTGYSGTSCETSWTSEYIGTYVCSNEQCTSSVNSTEWQSPVTVSSTNSGYTITIGNFANTGSSVDATVDSNNHVTITLPAGTYGFSGSGYYSVPTGTKGEIYLHYGFISSSGAAYSCNMKMMKE